jgi:cysteinyl-tRNA synthetase
LSDGGRELHGRFVDAVDDDLDLPTAMAVVRSIGRSDLPADERRWLMLDADLVLGLDLGRTAAPEGVNDDGEALDPASAALIAERSASRAAGDYARADAIRNELRSRGLEVTDDPDGTTRWRRTPR